MLFASEGRYRLPVTGLMRSLDGRSGGGGRKAAAKDGGVESRINTDYGDVDGCSGGEAGKGDADRGGIETYDSSRALSPSLRLKGEKW